MAAQTIRRNGAFDGGVISDGGVHGHLNHIVTAAQILRDMDIPVVLHAIADGRDVAPRSAETFFTELETRLPQGTRIGTVIGRYYAMDRDNRWDRVATAFNAMVLAKGPKADTWQDVVQSAYDNDVTDEFIPATVLPDHDGIKDNDGLFCLNFRADRAREILAAIGQKDFDGFETGPRPAIQLLGMVSYSDVHDSVMDTAFPKRDIKNTLGEWVSKHGLRQFRLAETEKYPHVTFFLNGGVETPYPGEDRFMPKSPNVATYDLQPEMSASDVTAKFVAAIEAGYDLIVTNYANPDMVGHTGDLDAAIKACEAVDQGLGQVVEALKQVGGAMVLTADHGNCEMMIDPETGGPHTAHTTNLVPVILVNAEGSLRDGRLADLAPTVLDLMGLEQPTEMTGESLIQ